MSVRKRNVWTCSCMSYICIYIHTKYFHKYTILCDLQHWLVVVLNKRTTTSLKLVIIILIVVHFCANIYSLWRGGLWFLDDGKD